MKRSLETLNCIFKQMSGSLLPRVESQNSMLVGDVMHTLQDIKFESNKLDRKNMRGDVQMFGLDFKKATELSKVEFKTIL